MREHPQSMGRTPTRYDAEQVRRFSELRVSDAARAGARPPSASRDQAVGLTTTATAPAPRNLPARQPLVSTRSAVSHADFLEPNGNRLTLCDRAHRDALVN